MPLILANSHSHEFTYETADGVTQTAKILRGQAIPADVPVEVITRLVAETVVSFNGETLLPRYQHVADVDGASHSTGIVTTQKVDRALSEQPGANKDQYTAEDLAKMQAEAEAAAEAEAQRVIDADAAAEAAAAQLAREQAEEEVVEVDEKAALRAEAEALGLKLHPATGVDKLKAAIEEAKNADD